MRDRAGALVRAGFALPAAVAAGVLMLVASASAQEPQPPITAAQASQQLDEAIQSLQAADPQTQDPTVELRDLALALPHLDGAERRQARVLLSRPPADEGGAPEPFGGEWTPGATSTQGSIVSPGRAFRIHWVEVGKDAPPGADGDPATVPPYVNTVAARADTSEAVQNDNLGWPAAKSDGTKGGDGRVDIYLSDICDPSACVFGYAGPDDRSPECNQPPFRCFAYLVLDDDYSPAEFGYADPDIPLSVTVAHEHNHVLQFRIDAIQDAWMFESSAVWAEEKVFPTADDWLNYMGVWANGPDKPITKFGAQGGLRVYGSAVWNHWLELGAGYGPDVVLDSWQRSRDSSPKDYAVGAYHLGIRDNGGRGFGREFARFAAATAEWRVADGNFPDEAQLPDVARGGTIRRNRGKAFELDHTTYRLLKVNPGAANRIRLRVAAPRRVRTGVALIGRTGGEVGGTVTRAFRYLRRGRDGAVRLRKAQSFERITAVVANADGRVNPPWSPRLQDWIYTRDDKRFRIVLR